MKVQRKASVNGSERESQQWLIRVVPPRVSVPFRQEGD